MEEEEYLDDFAVDDVADGLGRCLLDEGEKESFAQFFLHLHFQIRVHKQFETFIINILPKKEQKKTKKKTIQISSQFIIITGTTRQHWDLK